MSIDGDTLIQANPYAEKPTERFKYGNIRTDVHLTIDGGILNSGQQEAPPPHFAGGSNYHFVPPPPSHGISDHFAYVPTSSEGFSGRFF